MKAFWINILLITLLIGLSLSDNHIKGKTSKNFFVTDSNSSITIISPINNTIYRQNSIPLIYSTNATRIDVFLNGTALGPLMNGTILTNLTNGKYWLIIQLNQISNVTVIFSVNISYSTSITIQVSLKPVGEYTERDERNNLTSGLNFLPFFSAFLGLGLFSLRKRY